MAGLDGIKNKIDPHANGWGPYDVNLYNLPEEEKAKLKGLPTSLESALDALEADHEYLTAGGVFPEILIKNFIATKRKECSELSKIRKQFENDIYSLETSIFSVQEKAFDLRMLPINLVLQPLKNKISLEAIGLDKKVKCEISETDIAVDKVILEELSDILMHLIKNALDHGIETPEERKKTGKDEEGTITITSVREARYIELKISDDGRGLNYDKIRLKATKLYPDRIEEIKQMTDRELSQFLFQAGFSTKEEVGQLSDGPAGLDVVWTKVEKIKGRIKIESTKDKGTTFILHFPLSLSSLQGLFVFSNKEKQ